MSALHVSLLRVIRPLSALGTALLLTLTMLASGGTAAADRPDQLPAQASPEPAQEALEQAQELFAGGDQGEQEEGRPAEPGTQETEPAPEAAPDVAAEGREATLALRDLAVARESLRGQDRKVADEILARPTSENPGWEDKYQDGVDVKDECATDVCVHWVERSSDRIDRSSDDGDQVPDYAQETLRTLQEVHDTYQAAGYKEPLPDGKRGDNKMTDIYLADVGDDQLYGYCVPERKRGHQYTYQAYCVLDNDYAASQYGDEHTPLDLMRVTAAHEYFHAVQFAHDATEDSWFMEATATWAEDEVYDGINDSRQYLRDSPIRRPRRPLDANNGMGVYGDWIFFRHLTERMNHEQGGMPTLVRDMWRRADATKRDNYSLQAVKRELAQRKRGWARNFAQFAADNRRSRRVYDEGRALKYPKSPLVDRRFFSPKHRRYAWAGRTNHLTSATVRLVPGRQLRQRRWKARVVLDMAPRRRGSAAMVTTYPKGGDPRTRFVRVGKKGNAKVRVPFSRRTTKAVEVTMVNASTRTRCWADTYWRWSCSGEPRDDRLRQRLRVVAFR
jgi:hypothetical protein